MIKKILDLPLSILHIFLHRSFPLSSSQNLAYPRISSVFQGKTPLLRKRKQQCSLEHPTLANPAYDSKAAG